jgi:phenylpropionate dioxygenase-like ring-hydroxylating dioxygenase large terminal subunit
MNAPLGTPAASLRELAERLSQRLRTGERRQGESLGRIPVAHYLDPAWFAREREALFRDTPLCVAHASELVEPGSVRRFDASGTPLLLVRDAAGALHGLLNVCRHRGMRLVEEAACSRRSLSCPYHGWTYALDGRLRHIPLAETFDGLDPAHLDLVRVPVAERGGMVWCLPRPGASFDADAWLGPLIGDLEWAAVPDSVVFRRFESERACNWKLVVEAFIEVYHLRVLHRDSLYPFFLDSQAEWDLYGPHLRMVVARRRGESEPAWSEHPKEVRHRWTFNHLVFPNLILVMHPDYVSAISLWPLAPDRTRWSHAMLIPRAKSGPDWTPHWEKTMALLEQTVFQKEDLYAAEGIQQGLASGANTHMNLGRLECLLGEFHRQVGAAVAR